MDAPITTRHLSKAYGPKQAIKDINLDLPAGRIVGLVGVNGAGKTTLLKALTGQIDYRGEVRVLGMEPLRDRKQLMMRVGVIHDTPVLPPWMRVMQLLEFMQGVHPNFDLEKAQEYISNTAIEPKQKIKRLSKGMKTQLHLSIVLSTKTDLLILDEPTHGLDILFRKKFQDDILSDYFNEEKTIVIATHQIEFVEPILSDIIFLKDGKVILYDTSEHLISRYVQLTLRLEEANRLTEQLTPLSRTDQFGRATLLIKSDDRESLSKLGEIRSPSIAEIFAAVMGGAS